MPKETDEFLKRMQRHNKMYAAIYGDEPPINPRKGTRARFARTEKTIRNPLLTEHDELGHAFHERGKGPAKEIPHPSKKHKAKRKASREALQKRLDKGYSPGSGIRETLEETPGPEEKRIMERRQQERRQIQRRVQDRGSYERRKQISEKRANVSRRQYERAKEGLGREVSKRGAARHEAVKQILSESEFDAFVKSAGRQRAMQAAKGFIKGGARTIGGGLVGAAVTTALGMGASKLAEKVTGVGRTGFVDRPIGRRQIPPMKEDKGETAKLIKEQEAATTAGHYARSRRRRNY